MSAWHADYKPGWALRGWIAITASYIGSMADLHVFIDTSAWLAFYAFTNDDLEQLRKVIALIKSGKLQLYTDQQLADEFYRNRERKLDESLREFTKTPVPKGIPRYMTDYPEANGYSAALTKSEQLRDALICRAKEEAQSKQLAADVLFADILDAAPPAKVDNNIIAEALNRRLKGNPPGKYPSLGDQIHWEVLLRDVAEGTDLHLVSKDGDFESKLVKGTADQFLIDEWRVRKKGSLTLHNELRPFLNSKFPDIKLAVDVEKNEAVERLISSGFFSSTHSAIARLALLVDDLSWSDADKIFTAGLTNTQIKWIGTDSDVSAFYQKLINKFGGQLSPERKAELETAFTPATEPDEDENLDDDVPF